MTKKTVRTWRLSPPKSGGLLMAIVFGLAFGLIAGPVQAEGRLGAADTVRSGRSDIPKAATVGVFASGTPAAEEAADNDADDSTGDHATGEIREHADGGTEKSAGTNSSGHVEESAEAAEHDGTGELADADDSPSKGTGNGKTGAGNNSGGAAVHDLVNGQSNKAGQALSPIERIIADPEGNPAERGEILAVEASPATIELARDLGYAVISREKLASVGLTLVTLRAPQGIATSEAIKKLQKSDPSGAYAFNHVYYQPAAAHFSKPVTGQISLQEVPQQAGTRVGLIDSSVTAAAPAFKAVKVVEANFTRGGKKVTDHGTAVASVLSRRGVSEIFSANIYNGHGSLSSTTASSIARAFDWMVQEQVPVINVSLAGPANAVMQMVLERVLAKGHVVVAAVGNDGPASPPLYPAAYLGVVAVTAIDSRDLVFRYANRGPHLVFSAFGVDVPVATANGQQVLATGTSFAAPQVAALIASRLLKPDKSKADTILAALTQDVIDLGPPGRDDIYGYGLPRALEGMSR